MITCRSAIYFQLTQSEIFLPDIDDHNNIATLNLITLEGVGLSCWDVGYDITSERDREGGGEREMHDYCTVRCCSLHASSQKYY
jgi:hypothetical protein